MIFYQIAKSKSESEVMWNETLARFLNHLSAEGEWAGSSPSYFKSKGD